MKVHLHPRTAITASLCMASLLGGCGAVPDRDANAPPSDAGTASTPPQTGSTRATPPLDPPSPTASDDAQPGTPIPDAGPSPGALFHAAYQRVEDDWIPVLYLCDGVAGNRLTLVTTPDAKGLSRLWTYHKPDFRTVGKTVRIGDEDAGAGQIYRELRTPDGTAFGTVHSINPGILGDAQATTLPTLSSITDGDERTQCRWMPRGRILLATANRSVLVTADTDGGYRYQSFDYARPGKVIAGGEDGTTSTATTTVTGGRLIQSSPGKQVYRFVTGPWTYQVSASADNRAPGASVTVLRDGKAVTTTVAAAYVMAAKRIE